MAELIDSKKVGYMALLRNLRNILNANPSNVNKVLEYIENPEAVKKSKQLPFRYLSAYKELKNTGGSRVFDALENAVEDLKMATRRYAKRQLTWFRRNKNINWIYPDLCTSEELYKSVDDIITKYMEGEADGEGRE